MGKLNVNNGKINFKCKMDCCECSCCGPFSGVSGELGSIDNRPFDEIVLTPEDVKGFKKHGCEHLIEEGYSPVMGKKYYKIALEEDGTCKAFKDGRCTIHEFSPTLCKAFPFYFDMFAGLCAIECDGVCEGVEADLADYAPFIENAKKMYRYWIKFYTGMSH